nr:MAG TPA: baseplate wedge protein [Bacteriophage sp.]
MTEKTYLDKEHLKYYTDKLKKRVLNDVYPVGSIYISINSIDPGELFEGTWEPFAEGRTLIGVNTSDDDFDKVEKTGGEKEHILTIQEMPSHYHQLAIDGGSDAGTMDKVALNGYGSARWYSNTRNTGNTQPHNNMPPYITCYMWVRTA